MGRKMREYEVEVVEELCSVVCVEAHDEDEAYDLAMEELSKDFSAPYHYSCDVLEYTVTPTGEEYEEDEE